MTGFKQLMALIRQRPAAPKRYSLSASEMLTSSEIESLRRTAKEQLAYARAAFRTRKQTAAE